MSTQALSDVFADGTISSGIWTACSPDRNLCDFVFCGCLKDRVYNSNPRTEEPKENIPGEIANISAEQLQRVNLNLFGRCEYVHV
jgi:hypothetical protein